MSKKTIELCAMTQYQCLQGRIWLPFAKALTMNNWKGDKQTFAEKPKRYTGLSKKNKETQRKLRWEQDLLIVKMRLRCALSVGDLAFRFASSYVLVSTAWVKLMRMELSWLIAWPSREQTRKTLPKCFQNRSFITKQGALLTALKSLSRHRPA